MFEAHHNHHYFHAIEVLRYTHIKSHTKTGYRCEICDRVFSTTDGLNRHRDSVCDEIVYPCTKCERLDASQIYSDIIEQCIVRKNNFIFVGVMCSAMII